MSLRASESAGLGIIAAVAFLLVVHNYGISILPSERWTMEPGKIQLLEPGAFAYAYDFDRSEPDIPYTLNWRSRVRLTEDGRPLYDHRMIMAEVLSAGAGRWSYQPGRLIFSTSDNTDPRTNGRIYKVAAPILYGETIGLLSTLALLLSVFGLYRLNRAGSSRRQLSRPPREDVKISWRWHLAASTLLFAFGLYCNTGTLSPYAITAAPHMERATGYLYNQDHDHFRALFSLVDGAPREKWDHELLLRRVLFPVLSWPLMRLFGFETGGTLASLAMNVAAFVGFAVWLRRRVGARGAVFAAWLLALAPGAAYWGGLPYPYALIFPGSLLLMACLVELGGSKSLRQVAALSLGMGVLYLGYDFAVFFLPATVIVLALRRRFGALAVSAVLQLSPVILWLLILRFGLRQPLENSNAGVYHGILSSYFSAGAWANGWANLSQAFETGLHTFFGANFIFLPALFILLVCVNPMTSRVRFLSAEIAVLLAGMGLFLFNNLAPAYGGWDMHGSWVARIYQPVFPVFVLFAARWRQSLPSLSGQGRWLIRGAVLAVLAGNALIVFGPITLNPLGISEFAFYRFYNHSDGHGIYESNLRQFGRRPLGWPKSPR